MGGFTLGKGKALGSMSVLDLFFFVMLAACVVFQTWGYSFNDKIYIGVVVLAGILAAAKMLASRYTARDLFVCVFLLGIGLFFALKAHRYTVLLSAVLLIAAKGVETRRLLTGLLGIKAFAIASLFVLAAVGVFGVETFQHYRMTSGEFETRTLINGAATNIVHLGFFTVAVLWLCLRYRRIRVHDVVVLLALDVTLYLGVTRSTAGVALSALAVLLIFTCSKSKGVEGAFLRLAPFVPFALMLIMVTLGYAYGSSGFMDFINKLSTGRIAYDHYWLTAYGPTLLGSDFAELTHEGNFDDSFVYVLVVYGIVFAALLYGAVTKLLVEMRQGGAASGALLVVLFLVYSGAESMYPSAVVNPSLFLLISVLFDGQPKAGGLDDGVKRSAEAARRRKRDKLDPIAVRYGCFSSCLLSCIWPVFAQLLLKWDNVRDCFRRGCRDVLRCASRGRPSSFGVKISMPEGFVSWLGFCQLCGCDWVRILEGFKPRVPILARAIRHKRRTSESEMSSGHFFGRDKRDVVAHPSLRWCGDYRESCFG